MRALHQGTMYSCTKNLFGTSIACSFFVCISTASTVLSTKGWFACIGIHIFCCNTNAFFSLGHGSQLQVYVFDSSQRATEEWPQLQELQKSLFLASDKKRTSHGADHAFSCSSVPGEIRLTDNTYSVRSQNVSQRDTGGITSTFKKPFLS